MIPRNVFFKNLSSILVYMFCRPKIWIMLCNSNARSAHRKNYTNNSVPGITSIHLVRIVVVPDTRRTYTLFIQWIVLVPEASSTRTTI